MIKKILKPEENKLIEHDFKWWFKFMFKLGLAGALAGFIVVAIVISYFMQQVPDFRSLADYKPSLVTKVYANDGTILAEYAKERRIYVPIEEIPQEVIAAYLAAEDAHFFEHSGFDLKGIIRAALVNIFTNRKQGASTITQQLVKTSLLSSERTYTRKIKEIILSYRIEKFLSKKEILELYLNQIYLGNGAYGVGAAAIAYFNKSLDELTLGERAMLAGLPKAPSAYNPMKHPRVARLRRDIIIKRMETEGFITKDQATEAIETDLVTTGRPLASGEEAPHFSEHIRRYILDNYGEEELYRGGYSIFTTLDPKLQKEAEYAVYRGLREFDRRRGYRGPIGKIKILLNWQNRLEDEAISLNTYKIIGEPAVILEIDDTANMATIGLKDGNKSTLPFSSVKWARKYVDNQTRGPIVKYISDVLSIGDIVMVKPIEELPTIDEDKPIQALPGQYGLEQIPDVQGALIAQDVESGAILAMVGGLGGGEGFNRAIQAKRQVGSSFKPFVYALALEKGFTPSSIILDAPVVLRTNEMNEAWKPHNYSEKVYGPSTLRRGLEKSRNLMTIRLARKLGIGNIINDARKYGFTEQMERDLSTALGSSSFSLLELTNGYSVFANQGKKVEPYFINYIKDSVGTTVFSNMIECTSCNGDWTHENVLPPEVNPEANEVISPQIAYQTTEMLRGVVIRGSGWRAKDVGHPVAGKTGTTNDYVDAWFTGFSKNLVAGVWVGYDNPQSMGPSETGSRAAAPIWTYFMTEALKNKKQQSFDVPEGINFVRIDADTGLLPTKDSKETILEAFIEGTEPTKRGAKAESSDEQEDEVSNEPITPVEFQGIY